MKTHRIALNAAQAEQRAVLRARAEKGSGALSVREKHYLRYLETLHESYTCSLCDKIKENIAALPERFFWLALLVFVKVPLFVFLFLASLFLNIKIE